MDPANKVIILKELESWKRKGIVDDDTYSSIKKEVEGKKRVEVEPISSEQFAKQPDLEGDQVSDAYSSAYAQQPDWTSTPWFGRDIQGYPVTHYGATHHLTLMDLQKLLIAAGGIILFLAMLYLGILVWISGLLGPFEKTFILATFYLILSLSGGFMIMETQRWFKVGKTVFFVSVLVGMVCTLYVYFILDRAYLHPSVPLFFIPVISYAFVMWRKLMDLALAIYPLMLLGITISLSILGVNPLDIMIIVLIVIDLSALLSGIFIYDQSETLSFHPLNKGIEGLIKRWTSDDIQNKKVKDPDYEIKEISLELMFSMLIFMMVISSMSIIAIFEFKLDMVPFFTILMFIPPVVGTFVGISLSSRGLSTTSYLLIGLAILLSGVIFNAETTVTYALIFWFLCLSCLACTLGLEHHLRTKLKKPLRDREAKFVHTMRMGKQERTSEDLTREHIKNLVLGLGVFGFLAASFSSIYLTGFDDPGLLGIFLIVMIAFPLISFGMGLYLPSQRISIPGFILTTFGIISALGIGGADYQSSFAFGTVFSLVVLILAMVYYSLDVEYDLVREDRTRIEIYRTLVFLAYIVSIVTLPQITTDMIQGIVFLGFLTFMILLWAAWKIIYYLLWLTVAVFVLICWIVLVGIGGLGLFGAIIAFLFTSVILFILSDYIGKRQDKLPKSRVIPRIYPTSIPLKSTHRCLICGNHLFFDIYYRTWRCTKCEEAYLKNLERAADQVQN